MDVQSLNFSLNTENGNENLKAVKILGTNTFQRNPTHTIVLLDISSSMNEDYKLNIVKKSLQFLFNFLQSNDAFSLITFNNISNIVISNKLANAENLALFNYTINKISASGGTNLSAGLLNTKSLLESFDNASREMKTGLIILTDGHTNQGIVKELELLQIMWSLRNAQPNLSINTIGYGEDHNANLLKNIAINGNGSYNIVRSIEEVGTVFGDVLGGLISCVLQNLLIKYPSSWNCLNEYPKNNENGFITMNIGDIYAESETIVLFENADSKSVHIQGTSTTTFNTIIKEVNSTFNPTSVEYQPFIVSYVRLKIANCLNLINDVSNHTSIKNKIPYLLTILETPTIQSNPLVPMLKDEIYSIEQQINTSNIDDSQNLQHSAFFTLSRGISVSRTPRQRNESYQIFNDVNERVENMTIESPFANTTQRYISRTMASQSQDPSNNSE
jgi:Mg-chelatase subunit ChlD